MQRIELGNLIESPTPLENINDLWVDINENTGGIGTIHKYNKGTGEWEPYLVSQDSSNSYGKVHIVDPDKCYIGLYNEDDVEITMIIVVVPGAPTVGAIEATSTNNSLVGFTKSSIVSLYMDTSEISLGVKYDVIIVRNVSEISDAVNSAVHVKPANFNIYGTLVTNLNYGLPSLKPEGSS